MDFATGRNRYGEIKTAGRFREFRETCPLFLHTEISRLCWKLYAILKSVYFRAFEINVYKTVTANSVGRQGKMLKK